MPRPGGLGDGLSAPNRPARRAPYEGGAAFFRAAEPEAMQRSAEHETGAWGPPQQTSAAGTESWGGGGGATSGRPTGAGAAGSGSRLPGGRNERRWGSGLERGAVGSGGRIRGRRGGGGGLSAATGALRRGVKEERRHEATKERCAAWAQGAKGSWPGGASVAAAGGRWVGFGAGKGRGPARGPSGERAGRRRRFGGAAARAAQGRQPAAGARFAGPGLLAWADLPQRKRVNREECVKDGKGGDAGARASAPEAKPQPWTA